MEYDRLVTHSDFDGIVSALLLREIFPIDNVLFAEPSSIQKGFLKTTKKDIVCDLPKGGGLWFDHHSEQEVDDKRECHYDLNAKSCARVIYETYKDKLNGWEQLVEEADKIDSATFTKEEYLNPNACGVISITLRTCDKEADDNFRMYVLNLLSYKTPEEVAESSMVVNRYHEKLDEWSRGEPAVEKSTVFDNEIAVVDFVCYGDKSPVWRMHKLYIDHPEVKYVMSARRLKITGDIKMSCGTNVFDDNESYRPHIGQIMKEFGGGGHKGVGGCTVEAKDYLNAIRTIKEKLRENE